MPSALSGRLSYSLPPDLPAHADTVQPGSPCVIAEAEMRAAADELLEAGTVPSDDFTAQEVREESEVLIGMVCRVLGAPAVDKWIGQLPQPEDLTGQIPVGMRLALRHRLLKLLQRQLLRRWSSPEEGESKNGEGAVQESELDPSSRLTVLAAVEKLLEDLETRDDVEFVRPLSGSRGLQLLSEIAHDLRSPLTSILTLAEALRRGQSGEVNDVQRRQLGLIYSAALGLSTTTSDVTELAQSGACLAEERYPVSIEEILESVRDMVLPMAEEKGLDVRLLPGQESQRLCCGLAVSRVLLNLTTNALKFTEEGYVELATCSKGPIEVEFSVRDTGPGIDPEARDSLYRIFRRDPDHGGEYFSGTGLGLVICQRLVRAMGGELQFETESNWGTRFSFTLELPPV